MSSPTRDIVTVLGLRVVQLEGGKWRVTGDKLGQLGRLVVTALTREDAIRRYLEGDFDPVEVKVKP